MNYEEDEELRFKTTHSKVDSLISDSVQQVGLSQSLRMHNSVDRAADGKRPDAARHSHYASGLSGPGFSSGKLSPTKSFYMSNVYDQANNRIETH